MKNCEGKAWCFHKLMHAQAKGSRGSSYASTHELVDASTIQAACSPPMKSVQAWAGWSVRAWPCSMAAGWS